MKDRVGLADVGRFGRSFYALDTPFEVPGDVFAVGARNLHNS